MSRIRRALSTTLCVLLAFPPVGFSAPLGTLKGVITVQGRPISGIKLALVELDGGTVHRLTSGTDGRFEASLAPGRYVVSAEGQNGLVIAEAPTQVPVVAGRVAEARIDFAPVQMPDEATGSAPAAPPATSDALPPTGGDDRPPLTMTQGDTNLSHNSMTCFIAGEFPLLEADITPATSVARARVYFKSSLIDTYYYVEMTPAEGKFTGKLPRPRVEASPVTYYMEATTTDFTDIKLPEVSALIVEKAEDCPDKRVAAIGPPGEVTVFSAATGLAIAPAGFAAAAGGLLGIGGLAALIGGAAAAGIATTIVVFNPPPPPPTQGPTATPPFPTDAPPPVT